MKTNQNMLQYEKGLKFFDDWENEVKSINNDEDSLIRYLVYSGILDKFIELEKNINERSAQKVLDMKTYLLKDTRTNLYKIGRSCYPFYREKTLQSDYPLIEIVCFSDMNIESILHKKYELKRIRGEWFNLSNKDVFDIKKLFESYNQINILP